MNSINMITDKAIIVQQLCQSEDDFITLPELLAYLNDPNRKIVGFRHLQPYQQHAWYAFLAQLSAIARHCHPHVSLEGLTDRETWIMMLRSLTKHFDNDAPWNIINNDLDSPAFLQPPIPENSLDAFSIENTPDMIDILVLAKNHDVKQGKIQQPHISHWIFALVSLQTMQGYCGKFHYGVSRMNGGFGNRSCITFTSSPFSWGERLRSDVETMLSGRNDLCESYSFAETKGISLVWLEPWDGMSSLQLSQLDPFYIEVCRRLRLSFNNNNVVCFKKPTNQERINSNNLKGNVGDPWLIIQKTSEENSEKNKKSDGTQLQPKAITISGSGFSYKMMQKLLFNRNEYQWTDVQRAAIKNKTAWCLMHTLIRGQGETEGYHEKTLLIPPDIFDSFDATKDEKLAILSKEMIRLGGEYQKILKNSLLYFFQGKNDLTDAKMNIDFGDMRPEPWLKQYDIKVDQYFFPDLWDSLVEGDGILKNWKKKLESIVKDIFKDAVEGYAEESQRYFKNRAEAENHLNKQLLIIRNS